jgi:hypothetical protein
MSGSVGVIIRKNSFVAENPNDFNGSPSEVIPIGQAVPYLDLNRSQSAPPVVHDANSKAKKIMKFLAHVKNNSCSWKPTTTISLLKEGNPDMVSAIVNKIRNEVYKEFPHLVLVDVFKGERLDGECL